MYCSQSGSKSFEACMEDFWRHRRTHWRIGTKMTESILCFLSRQYVVLSLSVPSSCAGFAADQHESMTLWLCLFVRYMVVTCSIFSDLFLVSFHAPKSKGLRSWLPSPRSEATSLKSVTWKTSPFGLESSSDSIDTELMKRMKRMKIWDHDGSCEGSLCIRRDLNTRPIDCSKRRSLREQHIWPVAAPYASHELEWASWMQDKFNELQPTASCDVLQLRVASSRNQCLVQFLRFQLCIHLSFGLSL